MSAKAPLLPLEVAQQRLLALASELPLETRDVRAATGRYFVDPVIARRTQPAADLSAMDGYAVVGDDMAGPWQVIGESAAGHPFAGAVSPGEAVRIATGALLPGGAGAVILQEDLAREGDRLILTGEPPAPADKHIRRRGLDFFEGKEVIAAGSAINPATVALAISAGQREVPVRALPKIAIIDSGDELAAPGEALDQHRIPASNGAMLEALVRTIPCEAFQLGPVADDMNALAAVLARAEQADVIVTSGGASVGDHDLVKPALEAWGASIDFWRIAIKPGKPLLVATREVQCRRQVILGLPGNPVSSYVTAFLFLLPLVRRMLGSAAPLPRPLATKVSQAMPAPGSRQTFARGYWDGETVTPQHVQDSGALASLAASNVLIDRPAGSPALVAGEPVHVYLLESGGIA